MHKIIIGYVVNHECTGTGWPIWRAAQANVKPAIWFGHHVHALQYQSAIARSGLANNRLPTVILHTGSRYSQIYVERPRFIDKSSCPWDWNAD